jgi:hypothetical protein
LIGGTSGHVANGDENSLKGTAFRVLTQAL